MDAKKSKTELGYSVRAITPPGQTRPSYKPSPNTKRTLDFAQLAAYAKENGYIAGSTKPEAITGVMEGAFNQTYSELAEGRSVNLGGYLHLKLIATGPIDPAKHTITEANEVKIGITAGTKFALDKDGFSFSQTSGAILGAKFDNIQDASVEGSGVVKYGSPAAVTADGRALAKVTKDNLRVLRLDPETGNVLEMATIAGDANIDTEHGLFVAFPNGLILNSETSSGEWILANCRLAVGTVGTDGEFYPMGKAAKFNFVKGSPLITSVSQEGVEAANTVTFLDVEHPVTISGYNLGEVTTGMVQLVIRDKTTGAELERCVLDPTVTFTNTDTTITVAGGLTPKNDDIEITDGAHCTNRAFLVITLADGTVYEYEFHYQE